VVVTGSGVCPVIDAVVVDPPVELVLLVPLDPLDALAVAASSLAVGVGHAHSPSHTTPRTRRLARIRITIAPRPRVAGRSRAADGL
jgi:hypothetical protein